MFMSPCAQLQTPDLTSMCEPEVRPVPCSHWCPALWPCLRAVLLLLLPAGGWMHLTPLLFTALHCLATEPGCDTLQAMTDPCNPGSQHTLKQH